jgi:excisionase family DNA binding protein
MTPAGTTTEGMAVTWTREAIEALGPTTDVPTAASILSISDWTAYELIRRGTWDATRVLRLGRKIRIPTHDLIVLLYAPDSARGSPTAEQDRPNQTACTPLRTPPHVSVRQATDSAH